LVLNRKLLTIGLPFVKENSMKEASKLTLKFQKVTFAAKLRPEI